MEWNLTVAPLCNACGAAVRRLSSGAVYGVGEKHTEEDSERRGGA